MAETQVVREVPVDAPWWKHLSRYHWFVFIVASLAWLFDCLDQQLFILARANAMRALHPEGTPLDVINHAGGVATMWFMIGWATGGLIFGSIGDRIGRAKTLAITVLIYSLCTGLSSFAQTPLQFDMFRLLTGLGVGGVFGLAVALVADSLPERSRAGALGTLQALSAVGNIMAGLISIYFGSLVASGAIQASQTWKYMFWVGALPAFLCVFIQIRLREPEKWVKARAEGKLTGAKFGSYSSLLGEAKWRKHALLGTLLCVAGVVGLWGVGFFSPELVGSVIEASLREQGLEGAELASAKPTWIGINGIVQNTGAFLGMLTFTVLAQRWGRKRAFVVAFIGAFLATFGFFRFFDGKEDLWMTAIMGFFQLGVFAGFAIYLPELFPTRLRSTGTSFCYNVGRFLAATGPFTLAALQSHLAAGAATPADKLLAFRDAACWLSAVFLVGLIAVSMLHETKDKPLPE
jgi:MFS family permease